MPSSLDGPRSSSSSPRIDYSVIVPVYTNEGTLKQLIERLVAIASALPGHMEVVFVVDGAPDGSLAVLERELALARLHAQLLVHSRNFGSFAAIRSGLDSARGDFLGVMAADLQEPPELMAEFFAALSRGDVDIVVGSRRSRQDPALTSVAARAFWWFYRRFIIPDIPKGGVDVFGCTGAVRDRIVQLNEAHTSLVGLLYWVGYRRVEIPYDRAERVVGKSGWTNRKRVKYLFDSVFSFTDIPIQALTAIGVVGMIATLVVSLAVFVGWMVGRVTEPGYTPLMLAILFSTFSMLVGLGVVGSYVWRTYENSKARPNALVMSQTTFEGPRR